LAQMEISGSMIQRVAMLLANESCLRIVRLLSSRDLDVSTLAEKLDLTEPTVSVDVQELENVGLIDVTYRKGKRGIRKVCRLAKESIVIRLV